MSRIYIGNLPGDTHERELDDMFHRFRPRRVDLKFPPRGGAFAFVEFDDIRDAEGIIWVACCTVPTISARK
jgi:RNA recognition motif-containing protein